MGPTRKAPGEEEGGQEEPDTDPQAPTLVQPRPAGARRPLPLRGLAVLLGVYGLAVAGYVWFTYQRTPEYQAAKAYLAAHEQLGPGEGAMADVPALTAGYEQLLEAARLMPRVRELHEELERIRFRIEERGGRVPPRLALQAEAAAAAMQRLEAEDRPFLAFGARDRGWAPDQLAREPGRAVGWSALGGMMLIGFWAYLRLGARRAREEAREEQLEELERELAEKEADRLLNQRRR